MAPSSKFWEREGDTVRPVHATESSAPSSASSSPFATASPDGHSEGLRLLSQRSQSFKDSLATLPQRDSDSPLTSPISARSLDVGRAASIQLPAVQTQTTGSRDAKMKRVGTSVELVRTKSGSTAAAAKAPQTARDDKRRRRGSLEKIRDNIEGAFASFSAAARKSEGPKKKGWVDSDGMYTGLDAFSTPMHVLHVGKAATFYIATAQQTGLKRVVKVYDKAKMTLAHEKQVRNELALLLKTKHEGVLRCLGSWETPTSITVVQEYGIRGNLFSDLVGGSERLTERLVATRVLAPLLDTLAYLHAQQIIHRCIMPENLHWTGVGADLVLKLAHFEQAVDRRTVPSVRGKFGTLDYMAPEMLQEADGTSDEEAQADSYDEKVDIWAVGVLAYELLTGKGPFEVESKELSCMLILYGDIEKFPPKLSSRAVDFIRSALSKDPVDRPSAAELRQHPWLVAHLRADALGLPEGQEHMVQVTQEHLSKPKGPGILSVMRRLMGQG